MAKNRSAAEYVRRRRLGEKLPCFKHITKSYNVRYETKLTLTHQRMEEGMDKWLEFAF